MTGKWNRITLTLTAIALLLPAAEAQQEEVFDAGSRLAEEMAGIHRSLDRLVTLLEAHVQHQQIDLLIKRIELKERRLEPLEGRLRSAEGDLLGRENEIARMRTMLEQQRESLDDEIREGADQPESETRRIIEDFERIIRTEEAQLDDSRLRVRRLEDDLADQREEIEILDDALLEMLE